MTDFFKLLSNREISILIWSFVVFTFSMIKSNGSFGKIWNIIKVLLSKKIIPFYIIFGIYFFVIISLLNKFEIWEFPLYKDFIYWFLTTGIVLFFRSTHLKNYRDFTKIILTATSLTIILEFIIGFYNFSLFWELILIPTITFISLLSMVPEISNGDRNTKIVGNFFKIILAIVGFGILIYGIYQLIANYTDFFTLSNLKSFLLPPVFTLIFLLLIYYTVIYIKYERVFGNLRRYKFLTDKRKNKIRLSILKYANINFKYIDKANQIIVSNKTELQNEENIESYLRKTIK